MQLLSFLLSYLLPVEATIGLPAPTNDLLLIPQEFQDLNLSTTARSYPESRHLRSFPRSSGVFYLASQSI